MNMFIKSKNSNHDLNEDFLFLVNTDLNRNYVQNLTQDGYLLLIVLNGYVEGNSNFGHVKISKNELVFLPKSYVKKFYYSQERCRFVAFIFRQTFFSRYEVSGDLFRMLDEYDIASSFKLSNEERLQLSLYLNKISSYYVIKYHSFSYNIVKSNFISLLYEISFILKKKGKYNINKLTRKQLIASQFIKLVVQNYREQRKLAFYANLLFITAKHLMKVVKDVTGKTAGEIIDELVIKEATFLLSNGNSTISEVAFELNFSDPSFFGKYFKRHVGCSAKEFKISSTISEDN